MNTSWTHCAAATLFFVAANAAFAAADEKSLPITVANYSKLPVHATAIAMDEKDICSKLGLAAGSPFQVCGADGKAMPMSHGTENGRAVAWVYLAMAPSSRLDLMAKKADRWPDAMAQAKCEKVKAPAAKGAASDEDPFAPLGEMSNGVVRMTIDKGGWNLAFDAPADSVAKPGKAGAKSLPNTLIEAGQADFWIDNQNRGRIANADPKVLGLVHFPPAGRMEKCEASVTPDGRPVICVVSKLDGFAKNMTVTETYELLPGLPIMTYRIRWQNDGNAPLWVAYVRSGDGVKGRWGKTLMPTPLIERKKNPLMGDINGGETRPSWLGGLCRISMESPATGCGVGLSTLLPTPGKVGQGSMIWGCGASGFQCNFIDPEQGQFPFLVKPHSGLDNGFAFLCTQTGTNVFRQTLDLWATIQKGQIPQLASPCAVFVAGQPVHVQTVGELADAPNLLQTAGPARQAALRMDFNKYYECRLSILSATSENTVEVLALPAPTPAGTKPAFKTPITLLKADKPGEYKIDLNKAFARADEIPFILETKTNGTAISKAPSIVENLPAAPQMISPVPDASITDFAVMFRWVCIPMVIDYDVQWSQSADFASPVTVRVSSSQEFAYYLPPDGQTLAPGKYYWRLRGAKGDIAGAWSAPRNFTVNSDHATKPLKRPFTPASPLFTLEATRALDYTAFHPDVPADICPYVGIIAEGFESKPMTVIEFARGMDKQPHSFMLRSHWVSLADIEWLFQNVPNFIGIQGGEHLSDLYSDSKHGEMQYAHRLLRLCAKYGMIFQEADGTYKDDKWQDMMDRQGPFIRQFGPWLILSQKNNIIRRQFYSQSAALGLYLGGITHQHGAWEDGGFYWQNAGFKELGVCAGERSGVLSTMPRIFWNLVCVMGISRGCGMYSLDGQTLMYSAKAAARDPKGPWQSAIWNEAGETSDTFKRFVVPLIRGTVKHGLIPTREQMLQNIKLAVYNDKKVPGDDKAWPHYVEYGPLYAATYGFAKMGNIDGQLWEFFPNTGRYYYIPVLPQGNEPISPGVKNLPVSELQTVEQVHKLFDAAYPRWYDGDATVTLVGDTITVMNGNENTDVTQTYSVPLKGALAKTLAGKIGPHAYLLGKIENQGKQLWLQANTEYPDRDTELSITCSARPEWQVEPAAAGKVAAWDESTKTLNLHLSHQQGAVEVTLKTP